MAYNLREDWEQTIRNMARLAYENRYSASCQQWNNKMTDLVNGYKQEEMVWYNSPQITENGFRTTTQNLWYTHYLNKKRLMALGADGKICLHRAYGVCKGRESALSALELQS